MRIGSERWAGAKEGAADTFIRAHSLTLGLARTAGPWQLIRYEPAGRAYIAFRLSVPSSVPYGLALGPDGKLWFTADGSAANYVGAMGL